MKYYILSFILGFISLGFSQNQASDIPDIDLKAKSKFEFNFPGEKLKDHDRWFFYDLRTDDNAGLKLSKKPALVYIIKNAGTIVASYYFEFIKNKYVSQDCHCCHLEIESKLAVHCEETCKHVPKISDISKYKNSAFIIPKGK